MKKQYLLILVLSLLGVLKLNAQMVTFNSDTLRINVLTGESIQFEFNASSVAPNVTIESINITGSQAAQFVAPVIAAGTPLISTPSTFQMSYAPVDTGDASAVLTISTLEDGAPFNYTIPLEGHGDHRSLSFPFISSIGDFEFKSLNNDVQVPVRATGGVDVLINEIDIVHGDMISLETDFPIVVPGDGEPRLLNLRINPVSFLGFGDANVQITSNDDQFPVSDNLVPYNVIGPELNFPSQVELTVERLAVVDTVITINNTGSLGLMASNVFLSSNDADQFEIINAPTFPLEIVAGGSIDVTVRFKPTRQGDNISDRVFTSLILTTETNNERIDLLCSVTAPVPRFDRIGINFRDLWFNMETQEIPFSIIGRGSDLIISNIRISGGDSTAFTLVPLTFPITVANAEEIFANVTFDPVHLGSHTSTIVIECNAENSPFTFPLRGKGVQPEVTLPSLVDFGQVPVNRTSELIQIDLKNDGGFPLDVSDVTITGTDASLFTLTPVTAPFTLEPDGSTSFYVEFSSATIGNFTAQLNVINNALTTPDVVNLSAEAIFQPEFASDSSSLRFTSIGVGMMTTSSIPVKNSGSSPLTLINPTLEFGDGAVFSSSSNFGFPMTLPANGTADIFIDYSPMSIGTQQGTFKFDTDDPNNSEVRFNLFGNSTGPILTTSVSDLSFPNTFLGTTNSMSLTVTNDGEADLTLVYKGPNENDELQIYFDGVAQPAVGSSSDHVLTTGQSQIITVVFAPERLGTILSNIKIVEREFNGRLKNHRLSVSGVGVQPPNVKVGGMTFVADNIIFDGDLRRLTGNVRAGRLHFSGEVVIDETTNEVTGSGEVFTTDIAVNGNFGGDKVTLQEDGFQYVIDQYEPKLGEKAGVAATNGIFKLAGFPIKINKFEVYPDGSGMLIAGTLKLPEVTFGSNAGIFIDSLEITDAGVNIKGRASLNPELKVLNIFKLNKAFVFFNTFQNRFGGGAEIGINLMGSGVSIAAGIIVENGGLDSLGLEIEVSPGVPIGNTGLALAGGNGLIGGIQNGPLSLGLGVDITPAIPGPETVRLNNMQVVYTFGTSLEASGTLQIFGEDVAGAKVFMSIPKTEISGFVNLLGVLKGDAKVAVFTSPLTGGIQVEGGVKMTAIIPKDPPSCNFCKVFNPVLPLEFAQASAYFNLNDVRANLTVLKVYKVGMKVTLSGGNPIVEYGENFKNVNTAVRSIDANGNNRVKGLHFENKSRSQRDGTPVEQSIILDAKEYTANGTRARIAISEEESTIFDFTLPNPQENLIVKVVGQTELPHYHVILPTGQEITDENASSFEYLYTEIGTDFEVYYAFHSVLPGTYQLVLDASQTYEIDIFGAEFGPELMIKSVTADPFSNVVTINWKDEDLDSDAKVSLFYDTDQTGANGRPIVRDLSEDDETDSFSWFADSLTNGEYYIYGVIDDGSNAPMPVYFDGSFTINKFNPLAAPVLDAVTSDADTLILTWSEVLGAEQYIVYVDENDITASSTNFGAGDTTSFSFVYVPGKTYNFAVVSADEDFNESDLSNIQTFMYTSTVNNIPSILTTVFEEDARVDDLYEQTVMIEDLDVTDVLTLSLVDAPEGMVLNTGTISWTPTSNQVGTNMIKLLLEDGQGGSDSITYQIVVFDDLSSTGVITTSAYQFHGDNQVVIVTLSDPDQNSNTELIETANVNVTSLFDVTGIEVSLQETGVNTGVFVGEFTFEKETSDELESTIGTLNFDSISVTYSDALPAVKVVAHVLYEAGTELNNFPETIDLDNNIVLMNNSIGDLVGTLSTIDQDGTDTHSYSFVEGVGDEGNDLFTIDGTALKTNAGFATIADSIVTVRIRVVDSKNGFYEKTFQIINTNVTGIEKGALFTRTELFPNPASNHIKVTLEGARQGELTLEILSLDGLLLKRKEYSKRSNVATVSLNISNLPEGAYFIKIKQNNEVVSKKFIKQ